MKKVIAAFLGIGLVIVLVETIRRSLEEVTDQAQHDEFWYRLCGVWDEYTGLSQYIYDRRSFGNPVWEEGVAKHLKGLREDLGPLKYMHYSDDPYLQQCWQVSLLLKVELDRLDRQFSEQERSGMKKIIDEMGVMLEKMSEIGEARRDSMAFR